MRLGNRIFFIRGAVSICYERETVDEGKKLVVFLINSRTPNLYRVRIISYARTTDPVQPHVERCSVDTL